VAIPGVRAPSPVAGAVKLGAAAVRAGAVRPGAVPIAPGVVRVPGVMADVVPEPPGVVMVDDCAPAALPLRSDVGPFPCPGVESCGDGKLAPGDGDGVICSGLMGVDEPPPGDGVPVEGAPTDPPPWAKEPPRRISRHVCNST
jgi:hypothetical protein